MVKTIHIGLIPSPDLPARLTRKIINNLNKHLRAQIDHLIDWKIDILVDPLVGVAEYMDEMKAKAVQIKNEHEWDYVICLTDLPNMKDNTIVASDIDQKNKIAFIYLPAFGCVRIKHRAGKMICKIISELYGKSEHRKLSRLNKQMKKFNKKDHLENLVKRISDTENIKEDRVDIRYVIRSKIVGKANLLAGMTYANRPWTAIISFNKVLVLTFGTGIYISIFQTPWELSVIYSPLRFVVLMLASMIGMIIWNVFAHNLWEKSSTKTETKYRKLYNYTTISTLGLIVLINYVLLYVLFLMAVAIFVPPDLFKAGTNLVEEPSAKYFFRLTWLITSLGTLAGAIGTSGKNEEEIRQITYSYRQMKRYNEIEKDEETKCMEEVSTE